MSSSFQKKVALVKTDIVHQALKSGSSFQKKVASAQAVSGESLVALYFADAARQRQAAKSVRSTTNLSTDSVKGGELKLVVPHVDSSDSDSSDSDSSDMDEKEDQVEDQVKDRVTSSAPDFNSEAQGIQQIVVALKKDRDIWKDTVTTVRATLGAQLSGGWAVGVFFAGRSEEADNFLTQLKSSLSGIHDADYKEKDEFTDGIKHVGWCEGPRLYFLRVIIWDKMKDESLIGWADNSLYFQSPTFYTCPLQHAIIKRGRLTDCLIRFQTNKERASL